MLITVVNLCLFADTLNGIVLDVVVPDHVLTTACGSVASATLGTESQVTREEIRVSQIKTILVRLTIIRAAHVVPVTNAMDHRHVRRAARADTKIPTLLAAAMLASLVATKMQMVNLGANPAL